MDHILERHENRGYNSLTRNRLEEIQPDFSAIAENGVRDH